MTTTDNFTEAASAAAEEQWTRDLAPGHPLPGPRRMDRRIGFTMGALWARAHLAAQEESVLMTSREETISDRLSDAGYTEYAEDEDGGVTWVSAPLGEVLRIVSAAQEPTDAEVEAAARVIWHESTGKSRWGSVNAERRAVYLDMARAALSAARAARRDEEKR